jgi:heme/copper-type cytochrome/quinol oxidase subunit 4
MTKQIVIGFIISILTTLAGSYIYLEYGILHDFDRNWELMLQEHTQGLTLTYGALPNILLFFVFLKRKEEYKARGLMIAIITVTLVVFGYNFIW